MKRNWKTSLSGLVNALSTGGIGSALLMHDFNKTADFSSIIAELRPWLIGGLVIKMAAELFSGLVARDKDPEVIAPPLTPES